MKKSYFIPGNLDVDFLITQFPTDNIAGFKKERLLYIIDLITSIPANNRDLEMFNDYVPIYSQLLRRRVRNYHDYLKYLISAEVFEMDPGYCKGHSKGYRFTTKYDHLVEQVSVENTVFKKRVPNTRQMSAAQKKQYNYLVKWFNEKLRISYQPAMNFVLEEYNRKKDDKSLWDMDWKTGKPKDPRKQYNIAVKNISRIQKGDFYHNIDNNVHRFHSNLTNVYSELRNFIHYDNQQLCAVDVSNCQPYLSLILFSLIFWRGRESAPTANYKKKLKSSTEINSKNQRSTLLYKNINSKSIKEYIDIDVYCKFIEEQFPYIMYHNSYEIYTPTDFQKYIEAVTTGTFYEQLQGLIKEKTGNELKRDDVKELMFLCLYSSNKFFHQSKAKPKKLFKTVFPTVYNLFTIIKEKDHSVLPKLLQQIESYLFIEVIGKRIHKERPELPIFTIHDSVVTTKGNEEYVKRIIGEELTKAIDFTPTLKTEDWGLGELKKKDKFVLINTTVAA
jgi:hypothetical protein